MDLGGEYGKWNKSETDKNFTISFICGFWNKTKVTEKEIRFVVGRRWGAKELGEGGHKVQSSNYKITSNRHVMSNMITRVHNAGWYIHKLLRKWILKIIIIRKKLVTMRS